MVYIIGYFFIIGLVIGSFANVVGLRVPKGKSIAAPRSACPYCQHQLKWYELIPVFSYLFQGGKCKACKATISPLYPIMELLSGLLFAFAAYINMFQLELLVSLTFITMLLIITVSDLAYMLIPNKVVFFFFVLFIIERTFVPLQPWYDSMLGAVVAFLLLLLIALVSRGGMGGGDIKLFAVIGYALGMKLAILAFFFSAFLGAVVGLIGMALGLVKRKKPIPFGPFISVGSLLAYFFGEELLTWYISFLI
ncbi:prepilin peptidase [Salirhabdus salicampi]|uniref:prepilin peptidase n=1 Tax=Salirhabdus salicampi TaxID=476102 RepID=UPI0020C1BD42|nr:prepilin peptidase [Salirhabdus salicampi]